MGLVSNRAFNGSVEHNAYEFKHLGVNYLALYVDRGQHPNKPLTPDFNQDQFLRSYMTLFEGTGMLNDDKGHGIQRMGYKNGFAVYAFDLTPVMAEGSHVDLIKHGSIRMEIHFGTPLADVLPVVRQVDPSHNTGRS